MSAAALPWDRLRDVLALLARLDSDDPGVRRTAEEELAALRRAIEDGPSPGEVLGRRVAAILRAEAARFS